MENNNITPSQINYFELFNNIVRDHMVNNKLAPLVQPKSLDEWFQRVGVLDACQLTHLTGLDFHELDIDGDGAIDANDDDLESLTKFCEENEIYHIATRSYDDDDKDILYTNEVQNINRSKYYLCNGSKLRLTYDNYEESYEPDEDCEKENYLERMMETMESREDR